MGLLKSFPVLGLVLLLTVAGCGGESDTTSPGEGAAVSGGGSETASEGAGPSPTTGGLELRVTDAPPEGVTRIDVTVSNIEVHKADAEEEDGWINVFPTSTSTPQTTTFDLVELTGIEAVITQLEEFEAGKYTQIRMDVVTVSVTVDGEDREARVPSDKLKVVRPFDVEAGQNTILTLDFDAAESVVVTGGGSVQFKPTVKLLVRKEDRSGSEERGPGGQEQSSQASEDRASPQADRGRQGGQPTPSSAQRVGPIRRRWAQVHTGDCRAP